VSTLREAWLTHIDPDDYEKHMAAAGQAQANASLLDEFFRDTPPPAGSRILLAGAGTGQIFDYMRAEVLALYDVIFADINPVYLARLTARTQTIQRKIVVDDVENPALRGPFDLIVAILVLEHVDWRRAVAGMCRRSEGCIFTVIQQTPEGQHPTAEPVGTMSILHELRPQAIDPGQLAAEFRLHGFSPHHSAARSVAGNKSMLALEFRWSPPPRAKIAPHASLALRIGRARGPVHARPHRRDGIGTDRFLCRPRGATGADGPGVARTGFLRVNAGV